MCLIWRAFIKQKEWAQIIWFMVENGQVQVMRLCERDQVME